jgi:hypothetical protein
MNIASFVLGDANLASITVDTASLVEAGIMHWVGAGIMH